MPTICLVDIRKRVRELPYTQNDSQDADSLGGGNIFSLITAGQKGQRSRSVGENVKIVVGAYLREKCTETKTRV